MSQRDYYEVLGISKSASADEIKKAFRKAAVQHHPDKEGGDEAKFKEANEAYEVLSDQQKRQRYDQFGHAGVGGGFNPGASSGGYGPFQQGQVEVDFGDLGDIFSSFFGGGGGGFGRQQQRGPVRGRDVETQITLDFEESVFGVEKKIEINILDTCEHCKGTTAEPGHKLETCDTCKGSGVETKLQQTILGAIQRQATCSNCSGKGRIPHMKCTKCKGSGVEKRDKDVKIKIPSGISDGATMRLRGYGEAIAHGEHGDLYVRIRVKPHKLFTREGDLILSTQHIDMIEAALGTTIEVQTVDGPIKMKIPAGTQSGTDFKLKDHGVKHPDGKTRGSHIVEIKVDIPTKLSKKQKKLLEEF